ETGGIAAGGLDECLDMRAVEIGAHYAHALAVGPVELAVLPVELELLRGEGSADRDDGGQVAAVQIHAFDRAVVLLDLAHVGPEDAARLRIDHDTVHAGFMVVEQDLPIGAVGIGGYHAAVPGIEEKDSPLESIRSILGSHAEHRRQQEQREAFHRIHITPSATDPGTAGSADPHNDSD